MRPPALDTATAAARALVAACRHPGTATTLDDLRSDLAHETASKSARLAGLLEEWRLNRYRAEDLADLGAILQDLDGIHLRHARLAAARPGTLVRFVRLLAVLGSARRQLARLGDGAKPAAGFVDRLGGLVAKLNTDSKLLAEALSRHHGVRLSDVVRCAAEDVRHEVGNGDGRNLALLVEGTTAGAGTWVPRGEASQWSDVLRNLIRNAVQATRDERLRQPQSVRVRLLAPSSRAGTTVEILDEGVGMSPEHVSTMWRSGQSSHGESRGHGLTPGKLSFIESRAALEVRSAEGVGTCVRIDVPHRDIAIRPRRLWGLPTVIVPALALAAGITAAAILLFRPAIASVDVESGSIVRALDASGGELWRRDMGEAVLVNYLSAIGTSAVDAPGRDRHLIVGGRWPWQHGVVLATQPAQGPGKVWRLDARGHTRWVRTLRWTPPRQTRTGNLTCVFETAMPWSEGRRAIVLNVRDSNYSWTSIQFVTQDGEPLAEYNHPGQLEFVATQDVDGDGTTELILSGINNDASRDRSFLSDDPATYVDCLVMLHASDVAGQAWPYTDWEGVPAAREKAYLLIPPLRPGVRPTIEKVNFGLPSAPGTARIELIIRDGRIYRLDAALRPLSCDVGDNTLARALEPTNTMGPLLYLRQGAIEFIDLPIGTDLELP